MLINSFMISEYLSLHDDEKLTTCLRKTRASTRNYIAGHKIEFKEIKDESSFKVVVYSLNDNVHKIKVEQDETISDVSCAKCQEFCDHRRILLTHIMNSVKDESITRKRKLSQSSSSNAKRPKHKSENDSNLINISPKDEIKLIKKKKVMELPQELLEKVQHLKMEHLMRSFGRGDFKDFYKHCVKIMNENPDSVLVAHDLTVEQADTGIWHELRIGRITASRLHEATRCTMARGSFDDKLMGKQSGWSFAMMRGTVLEEFVFQEVKNEFTELQRAGLIMNHTIHPFFAASPDGLHKDFVLEIKCPSTQKTFEQYIDVNKLSKKYFAQIQLQMFITGKSKALLAVASLDFEKTRKITKIWIPFDNDYMQEMLEQAMEFYEKAVYPALKRKFLR